VTVLTSDVADAPTVRALIVTTCSRYSAAAIVSGQPGQFDLGMRINSATRHLLEAMRAATSARRVFSSSLAVFGWRVG
jgi:nucleoside-diphosphate-sugar epimerase